MLNDQRAFAIEAAGGSSSVILTSRGGSGTTFEVFLPVGGLSSSAIEPVGE